MTFWSQAWQDECVINMLNFKRNGFFLDIGSGGGMGQSNSYFFESEMGWKGICVERGVGYTEHYKNNRPDCVFMNEDATEIDYYALLEKHQFPTRLDYLSVDIDESSIKVLRRLPMDKYRFSVITIEHDAYRFQDQLRAEERSIINGCGGYSLLFPNVLVPLGCGMGPDLPFEDWWVDTSVFDMDKLHKYCGENKYPDDIANAFRASPGNFMK